MIVIVKSQFLLHFIGFLQCFFMSRWSTAHIVRREKSYERSRSKAINAIQKEQGHVEVLRSQALDRDGATALNITGCEI